MTLEYYSYCICAISGVQMYSDICLINMLHPHKQPNEYHDQSSCYFNTNPYRQIITDIFSNCKWNLHYACEDSVSNSGKLSYQSFICAAAQHIRSQTHQKN